jgi:YVTN family beta-propeller protein
MHGLLQHQAQVALALTFMLVAGGCAEDATPTADLARRAYVVSLESDELTVIDTETHAVTGRVATGGLANHMAEVSADLTRVFVVSSGTDEVIVVDATTLAVTSRIAVAGHPTHVSLSRDGRLLAVVAEDTDEVVFLDPDAAVEIARVGGLMTPHFVRWSADLRSAYVANIGGHHLTRIDLETMAIAESIVLDGYGDDAPAPDEGGFADAQIDREGVLWAAHAETGRVLVYDTVAGEKLDELEVGARPWIAFAEHPFPEVPLRHLVPSFGDRSVTLIDGKARAIVASLPGDEEAYGVNFSPLAPDRAFVMNRVRADVAVVDTAAGTITSRIPVGGNTETAATTADGRWIVAAVSGADRVVVIDPVSAAVVATIDGVGRYPWSVTIPGGQNYCH